MCDTYILGMLAKPNCQLIADDINVYAQEMSSHVDINVYAHDMSSHVINLKCPLKTDSISFTAASARPTRCHICSITAFQQTAKLKVPRKRNFS